MASLERRLNGMCLIAVTHCGPFSSSQRKTEKEAGVGRGWGWGVQVGGGGKGEERKGGAELRRRRGSGGGVVERTEEGKGQKETGTDRSYFGSSPLSSLRLSTPESSPHLRFSSPACLPTVASVEKQRSDRINVGAAWRFVPIAGLSFPPMIMTNCDRPASPEMPPSFSTARYSDWNCSLVKVFRSRAIVSLGIFS